MSTCPIDALKQNYFRWLYQSIDQHRKLRIGTCCLQLVTALILMPAFHFLFCRVYCALNNIKSITEPVSFKVRNETLDHVYNEPNFQRRKTEQNYDDVPLLRQDILYESLTFQFHTVAPNGWKNLCLMYKYVEVTYTLYCNTILIDINNCTVM